MKRILFIVAAFAIFAIPSIASAIPPKPGPYVSGFLGVNVLQNTNVSGTDFNSLTLNDRVEFDPSISIGGSGGYDFGYVRLEGELSYKHAEISSINDPLGSGTFISPHGSLGAFGVMANGFVDLHNASPVTPYFGGGIGFATLHLNETTGIERGGTGGRLTLYLDDDDTVFAYQAGAGLEIALNRRLSLDVGYRYFATDTARFNGNGSQDLELKYRSHSATVGVRFKF